MPAFRKTLNHVAQMTACFLLLSSVVLAASPRLTIIQPRGLQRGIETELTFSGSQLDDVKEVMFYEPGFEVKEFIPVNANAFKAKVAVAPTARLGEHVCQVRTATGISDYRTFYVGHLPDVAEVETNPIKSEDGKTVIRNESNSDFATPQLIPLNVTVTGIANNEDVDYYAFDVKKGQRISAEVEGMRLGTTLFDPYVAILDSKRFELASSDDSPLLIQDSVATAVAPEDGRYYVEVRESSYAGNGSCTYRLHVGTFPRPTAVYPAGGKIGEEVDVRFIGDAAGDIAQKVKLPAEVQPEFGVFAGAEGDQPPSWNVFRLSEFGNSLEVEPNNTRETASPAALPNAFNGILQDDGDEDWFKFTATKGQQFEVECYGRRIRSAIDPVMYLYNAAGGAIASNDDSRGPDSYFRFNVPADGEYYLRVIDHLGRGGKDFVYRVEFQAVQPRLALTIPRVERYGQYRQQIYVGRGNRFATTFNISRVNFGGDVIINPKELPPGVTMQVENVPANQSVISVVFEAAADAPLGGGLYDFTAQHAENAAIVGGFENNSDFIIGAPGQSRYYTKAVSRLPIAVVDEIPFKLDIVAPKVPIARNGSMQLKVVATKKEGWDEAITVQLPFRPAGIGAGSSIQIPKGQTEAFYPLSANGGAAIGISKIFVVGWANVGNGNGFSASNLTPLEVSEPFVTLAMNRAACDQGQPTEIVCQVTIAKAFDAAATVQIFGLPNKAVTEPVMLTKDSKEIIFKVTTDMTTPAGRHATVFAQITIPMNGENIVHNVGSTELRVDVPLPPKVEPPKPAAPAVVAAPTPAPAPAVAAPPRRLTRLEMLRLEKAKKAEAAGGGGE
ncbi:MAG: PPC domain-containing protein [Planctomycetota bacterium]|nr:PPC domain-containing protein [Planctomycetota bacterium]MDA1248296.1 PPC domain-containing protein [Planctomycetota bacterium]